jgi:ABC-2 type transport system ATP-binding protein
MIAARGLSRDFNGRAAVRDVTFEVRAGEVFGLLGPNGAGKTTTLRMLAGLIAPTHGSVVIEGLTLARDTGSAVRRRIGFLTEAPGLWDRLSVRTNLEVYARLYGMQRPAAAVERWLRALDLWDRRDDQAAELSRGMRQKVALARALLHDPAAVLLDEPTANLDPETARRVRDLIADLRDRGRAVIVSTHNLDEAERLSTRIAVLDTKLIACDAPATLRRRLFGRSLHVRVEGDAQPFAQIASAAARSAASVAGSEITIAVADPDLIAPDVVAALVRAGARVMSVHEAEHPLEDVYLRLVRSDS